MRRGAAKSPQTWERVHTSGLDDLKLVLAKKHGESIVNRQKYRIAVGTSIV